MNHTIMLYKTLNLDTFRTVLRLSLRLLKTTKKNISNQCEILQIYIEAQLTINRFHENKN